MCALIFHYAFILHASKDMLVISRSHNTLIRQLTAQIEHSDPIIMLNVHLKKKLLFFRTVVGTGSSTSFC